MPTLSHNNIPFLLRQISSTPEFLYYEGNMSFLEKKCLTIVGTRSITRYGKWVIEYLIDDFLKELDIVVVSGLARGVDAYVHLTCLRKNIPTIAIVPGTINSYIPKSNMEIFQRMKKEALVIAEFKEGIKFRRDMFVLRNRLLAGISDRTLVIEAGLGSGSLITANLALEYNRDIYVVPGNINNNMSQGCNKLIRQGADIITGLDDFKETYGIRNDQTSIDMFKENEHI